MEKHTTEYGNGDHAPAGFHGAKASDMEARCSAVMEQLDTVAEQELEQIAKAKKGTRLSAEEKAKADRIRRKALSEYKSSSEQLFNALVTQPGTQIVAQMSALMSDWPKNAFPSNAGTFERDITGALFYLASRPGVPQAAKEYAQVQICTRLENYARSQIYSYYSTYAAANADFVEDATSEAKANLLAALPAYDPERGMPTTFVKASFLAAVRIVQEQLSPGMSPSSHTRELIKVVSRAKQELAAEGIEPTAGNIYDRLRSRGEEEISTRIIAKTLETMANSVVASLDTDEMKEIADAKIPTPDKVLLDKEKRIVQRKYIRDNLTKEELRVARYRLYLYENNLPEKKQESADKLGYTIAEYNRIVDSMCKRLFIAAESGAYGAEIKSRYGHRTDSTSSRLTFAVDESYTEAAEEMVSAIVEIDLPIRADGFTKSMDESYIEAGAVPDNPGRIKSIIRGGSVVYERASGDRSI